MFRKRDRLSTIVRDIKDYFKDKSLYVIINDEKCKVLGRVGMYHVSVDVTDKNVASESYPGYSVTYQTGDENVLKAKQMEIKDIINTYLTGCKLD